MKNKRGVTRGVLGSAIVIGAALLGSGCVVNDIRDELVRVNDSLDTVESGLGEVRTEIAAVGAGLERTNERLEDLDLGLRTTNARLSSLDGIEDSLSSLDGHLAAIRELIDGLDSSIPFLDLGGDDDAEQETDESAEPAEPGALEPGLRSNTTTDINSGPGRGGGR